VILDGGGWPAVDRGVEPGWHVAQRHPEEPRQLAGAGEHVHGPVEQEVELFELIMVAALGSRLEIQVHLLEPGDRVGIAVLDRPGSEFPGEQSLADEDVTDVVPGERDDHEAPARLKPHQALRAQFQQTLTHRGGADAEVLGDRFGPDEIPAAQPAGDNEVAYVGRGLGAQLGAMAAVLPRPVRKLLGRLGQGFSVRGDGLCTA
jgi:hypothetical protein